ncbi:aspartyl protease family protein [Sphingomonas sp. HT-1]|uniref:aspartyl protease family protein n=1 Tax=unclassified Sphingomonas TaxID=196159 RepID=UPI00036B6F26|nr:MULTISPECIES: aspartyl protease family protein [unclassified Sphingomonas]KTF68261.1 hypothetical protein ATB93_14740 [Sphingomonas sp. WG]
MRLLILCLAAMQPNGAQESVSASRPGRAAAALRLRLADPADRAPMAYDTARNNILFQATINGRPATVLLDNGADQTLVDRGFAERAGIGLRASARRVVTSAMTQVATATTDPVTLEATRSFRVHGAMVALDLRPVEKALGRQVDAVLGSDVLDHFAVLIDPRSRRLSFHQGGSAKPMPGTTVLPIAAGSIVAAELNEQKVGLRIDLGYSGVIRLSDAAWRRVVPAGSPTRDGSQTSADGTTRATRVGQAALRMGTVRIERVPVDSGYVPEGKASGLLGNGFLSRGPFILDLKGRQLLLLPQQAKEPRTP